MWKCFYIKRSYIFGGYTIHLSITIPWHLPETALYFWPFVRGIHQLLVDSPHKGPVIHKVFLSRHHLISLRDSLIFASDSSLFLAICEGNLPVTGGFPSKRDSNVERHHHINGFVQERCNSSALAMELRLSCTNPSIYLWGIYSTLIHYHFPKSSLFLVICEGNPPVTGGFPPQRASNSEVLPYQDTIIYLGGYTIYQFITIPWHLPATGWW